MVTVTEIALEKVRAILADDDKQGHHLRLGIAGGGCSGFQYYLGLDTEIRDSDEKVEFEDFKLLIDHNSAPYMNGATLDYSTDPENEGFVFNNPNAPAKPAGCGGGDCCC